MSEPIDPMADLLRRAGSRPVPSAAVMQRVREVVSGEFAAQLARRRRYRHRLLAVAAAFGVLTVGLVFTERLRSQSVVVAQVSRVTRSSSAVSAHTAMRAGQSVRTGHTLRSPHGVRVLLAHKSGFQLRLDEDSALAFIEPGEVRLDRGAVYVETPRSGQGQGTVLAVATPWGRVTHVGTRFEVRLSDQGLRIRVRDGATRFTPDHGGFATIGAREQLDYRAGRIQISRDLSPIGHFWDWVDRTGPAFSIEKRTLLQALEWYSHEGGYRLAFANPAARARAAGVVLHGDVSGLTPREALEVVLSGTPLRYALVTDQVRVSLP